MIRAREYILGVGVFWSTVVLAEETTNQKPEEQEVSPEEVQQGISAFQDVYEVLQHPRCLNCHPSGDAPLQTDKSIPHAMNITRASTDAGLECATCHQTKNSEAYGVDGGPPGAPNWHLPEKYFSPALNPKLFETRLRWTSEKSNRIKCAGYGQEFVICTLKNPSVKDWARDLFLSSAVID